MWVLFFVLWLILCSAAIAGISAAPWVPTRKRELAHLTKIPFQKNGTVIDLGCGSGTVLFALAQLRPDLRLIGYEISLLPLFLAYARKYTHRARYKQVSIRFGNLFHQDLSQADGLIIFLLERTYQKLLSRLVDRLKDDCLLVVEAWEFPGLTPEETLEQEQALPLYLYRGNQLR